MAEETVNEKESPVPDVEVAQSLKRKQSTEPEIEDPVKKPRLNNNTEDTREKSPVSINQEKANGHPEPARNVEDGENSTQNNSKSHPPSPTITEPAQTEPAPQSTASKQPIDERKRGKRLFGAVFGALGHTTPSQLAKRREIEKKQREKLRAQAEEDDAAREERLARLRESRMKEQRNFDRQGMRIRHSSTLAMANSLYTKTEPRIYWKPWELLPEEEDRIRKQVQEAEDLIAEEREEAEKDDTEDRDRQTAVDGAADGDGNSSGPNLNRNERAAKSHADDNDVTMEDSEIPKDALSTEQNAPLPSFDEQKLTDGVEGKADLTMGDGANDVEDGTARKDDIDEGAEDIHGEDAVIY